MGCAECDGRPAQLPAGGYADPTPDRRCSRGGEGDVRQRQQLEALVLPSNTALIGGAGLFDVIHVIYFTYCISTAPNSL